MRKAKLEETFSKGDDSINIIYIAKEPLRTNKKM